MRDVVKLKVYGTETFVINLLNKKGIAIYRATSEIGAVTFEIDGKNLMRVKTIFAEDGHRYEIKKRRGMLFMLKKACAKLGLIFGALAMIAAFFTYSFLLESVEIAGDSVNHAEVMALLKQEGVIFPALNPNYDYKKLEIALLKLDRVSSATVEKKGKRLKITFLTELPPPNVIDMTKPLPVVSLHNAVITRIVLLSGTALVKPGDTVRAGETLIAPFVKAGEVEVPVRGVGEVYGAVYHGKKLLYADTVMAKSRTGRETVQVEVRLGALSTGVQSPYPSYEVETTTVRGSPIFPVTYLYHTFYETEDIAVSFDFEKDKELLIKEGFDALKEELPIGARVLERFYLTKRVDNSTVLELYYKTEELLHER